MAPPKRLTTKQRRVVGALVAKHGHDLNAMARDRKLNAMQHTIAQLRELVVSFAAYPDLLEKRRRAGFPCAHQNQPQGQGTKSGRKSG